jgi:hypothetical protein
MTRARAMLGLALGATAFVPRTQATCAHYDPELVRLTGHLSIDKKYGPPNYGETRPCIAESPDLSSHVLMTVDSVAPRP